MRNTVCMWADSAFSHYATWGRCWPLELDYSFKTMKTQVIHAFKLHSNQIQPCPDLLTRVRFPIICSPVIIVPRSRKTDRKMFPAKVHHLSMIFPSLKVKMIPKIWNKRQHFNQFVVCVSAGGGGDAPFTDLSRKIKHPRWGSLCFWVGELNSILKPQRYTTSHEEAAEGKMKHMIVSYLYPKLRQRHNKNSLSDLAFASPLWGATYPKNPVVIKTSQRWPRLRVKVYTSIPISVRRNMAKVVCLCVNGVNIHKKKL